MVTVSIITGSINTGMAIGNSPVAEYQNIMLW